jgi:hypothetical protein
MEHGDIDVLGYFVSNPTGIDCNKYASINAAVTAIGATQTTLVVSNAQTLTANLTIPSTLTLKILKGGSIVKASTYTLTVNGNFEADLYQVFSGFAAGDVTFGAGAIKEVIPQWFGATGNGVSNDTLAIQSSLDSINNGGRVFLPAGTYCITQISKIFTAGSGIANAFGKPLVITGVNNGSTIIKKYGAGVEDMFSFSSTSILPTNLIIENLLFIGATSNYATNDIYKALSVTNLLYFQLNKVGFSGFSVALDGYGLIEPIIEKCDFHNNLTCIKLDKTAGGGSNVVKVRDCNFEANLVWGIDFSYDIGLYIKGCDFSGNGTGSGITGGINIHSTAGTIGYTVTNIEDCFFEGNNNYDIYCHQSSSTYGNYISLTDCMSFSSLAGIYIGANNTLTAKNDFWGFNSLTFDGTNIRGKITDCSFVNITGLPDNLINVENTYYGSSLVTLNLSNALGIINSGNQSLVDAIYFANTDYPTSYRNKIISSISGSPNGEGKLIFSLGTGASTFADTLTVTNSGAVGIGTTNPQYTLDVRGFVGIKSTETTVGGSTSGNAYFSMPFQGEIYKKVVIRCAALLGTASYTFPSAFVYTPVVITTSGLSSSLVTTLNTTTVVVTGTTSTGYLTIEGY